MHVEQKCEGADLLACANLTTVVILAKNMKGGFSSESRHRNERKA